MAVTGNSYPTVSTIGKQLMRSRPQFGESMCNICKTGDLASFLPALEANSGSVHRFIVTTSRGEPGTWRALNKGVPSTHADSEERTEVCGNLEKRCDIDRKFLKMYDNPQTYIQNENFAAQAVLRDDFNDALIYGNRANPGSQASLDGFATRYSAKGKVINPNTGKDQVYDFGGTGDALTSAYVIVPGPKSVYLVHPQGSKTAGISIDVYDDKNGVFLDDAEGHIFRGHRTWYQMEMGLVVNNPNAVMRLANIPTANLTSLVQNGVQNPGDDSILRQFILMKDNITGDLNARDAIIVVGRDLFTQMDILIFSKTNSYWRPQDVNDFSWNKESVGMLGSTPVVMCDSILGTESQIV